MLAANTIPTSASVLTGMKVVDPTGASVGRVAEFAVDVAHDASRVAGLILKMSKGKSPKKLLLVENLVLPRVSDSVLHAKSDATRSLNGNDYLLLDRDLLDQQIIDVDGRKVVRVNDVNLAWEPGADNSVAGLVIQEVEVGSRGATRRLLKGLPCIAVEGLSNRFKARVIPWNCVDLLDRDPARRVKLKIGQDRLSRLHPSDIAALLEELAPDEREAVFSSLPEETAAEALEEFEPKMQMELVQRMDSERAADIIEEMDPGAAADLLGALPEDESDAILEEMEPQERQDVQELLEFSPDTAAGMMTTDYVRVLPEATVGEAVESLRSFEGDVDNIAEIYLVTADEMLKGIVTLPRLLLAAPADSLAKLAHGHNVSCKLNDDQQHVAQIFDKYNLRSLPVLDNHGKIAGVIHAEQVIAQLVEK
jgi:sporulation protein YlmC with PRC-barrel domain/CBS domain-containing protein